MLCRPRDAVQLVSEISGIPRLTERCSSPIMPYFRAKSLDMETMSPTRKVDGGEGGIRTHGSIAAAPVFKTGALNRSATSPLDLAGPFDDSGARRLVRNGVADDRRVRGSCDAVQQTARLSGGAGRTTLNGSPSGFKG